MLHGLIVQHLWIEYCQSTTQISSYLRLSSPDCNIITMQLSSPTQTLSSVVIDELPNPQVAANTSINHVPS